MLTAKQLYKKYGDPETASEFLMVLKIPELYQDASNHVLPKKICCNKDFAPAFLIALQNCYEKNCICEIKTFDGCYNVRIIRGGTSLSLHSWAVAVDLNASIMPLGSESKWSDTFIQCFTDAGFDWGGDFRRPDPMHFQLKSIP